MTITEQQLRDLYPGPCETLRANLYEAHRQLREERAKKDEEEPQSNMVDHARRELQHLGCSEEDIDHVVKVIRTFVSYGHSGSSAAWTIEILEKLLRFQNLTPLTDDPREWVQHEDNLWQNTRRGEAFSDDGGRTYWLLSEGGTSGNPHPKHISQMQKHKNTHEKVIPQAVMETLAGDD